MTTPRSGDWSDHLGKLLGDIGKAFEFPTAAPVKQPTIRSRRIDGILYVRADDVADALDHHLPGKATSLAKKLRGK